MGIVVNLSFYCNKPRCHGNIHLGDFLWPELAEIQAQMAERQWTYDAQTNTACCPKHGGKKAKP